MIDNIAKDRIIAAVADIGPNVDELNLLPLLGDMFRERVENFKAPQTALMVMEILWIQVSVFPLSG